MANELRLFLKTNLTNIGEVKFYRYQSGNWVEYPQTTKFNLHETVRIIATNQVVGYKFSHWTFVENGETLVTSVNPLDVWFDAVPEDPLELQFTAVYVPANYTINFSCSPASGVIDYSGGGTYPILNNGFRLEVSPKLNYQVVRWTKNGTQISNSAGKLFIDGEALGDGQSATYVCELQTYADTEVILTQSTPIAAGTVSGAGTYTYNTNYTITATPNSGFVFDGWYDRSGQVLITTSPIYTAKAIGNPQAYYYAKFSVAPSPPTGYYDIILNSNPNGGGVLNGAGAYPTTDGFTITATDNDGYEFVNWSLNGTVVSTNRSYTGSAGSIGEAYIYVANFNEIPQPTPTYTYTIKWNSNGVTEATEQINTSSLIGDLSYSINNKVVSLLEGAVSIASHTYGSSVTAVTLTRSGYTILVNAITTPQPTPTPTPQPPQTFVSGLYQMFCEENQVDKSNYLTLVKAIDGTLRDETSILTPTIILELSSLPTFNYVYISNMNRFYFVRDIQSVRNGLWRVMLEVDVLMTYRNEIRNQTALISRNEYTYNEDIIDNNVILEQEVEIETIVSTGSFMDNNGSICISVVQERS